jgi:hypothetical protein
MRKKKEKICMIVKFALLNKMNGLKQGYAFIQLMEKKHILLIFLFSMMNLEIELYQYMKNKHLLKKIFLNGYMIFKKIIFQMHQVLNYLKDLLGNLELLEIREKFV